MSPPPHEQQWAIWMRAALLGDNGAYRLFLKAIRPYLWTMARRRMAYLGPPEDAEDIVQEALLAIHLKRMSWDTDRPIGPWISVIMRHKLTDALRWRRRQVGSLPLDPLIGSLEAREAADGLEQLDLDRLLARLKDRPRDIVHSVSIGGNSVRETADRLGMTETAVRVTLHRALKRLAALSTN